MCFGNETEQKREESTTPLAGAAQANVSYAQKLQSEGFTPYSGQQVANFSPQQSASFGLGTDVANSVNGGPIGTALNNYTTAGPQHVTPETIASNMSPYMNAYVNQALQPQLAMQNQQFDAQNKGFDAQATGAGAFGDTGWGIGRTNLTQQQDTARAGLIGNAYTSAFNTAIGAGAQDTANNLQGQNTNASLAETALGRQLSGATAQQGAKTNAANVVNTMGGQQTAQDQAKLNAAYNQWQMEQQYPFQATQLVNSTLQAGTPAAGGTKTTYAPDNSGYGMLGTALGIAAAPFTGGMSLAALPAMGSPGAGSSPSMGGAGVGYDANGGMFNWAADGGQIPDNKPTVVGERGPEVFVPNVPGVVIPNEVLEAARRLREAKTKSAPTMQFGIAA